MNILSQFENYCEFLQRNFEYISWDGHCLNIDNQCKKTLGIVALIHGNEPGGIYVFLNLLNQLVELNFKYNLKLIVGNKKAFAENKRFIQIDLNRCFSSQKESNGETQLAEKLKSYFIQCDYLIDLHQTQGKTESDFFIFPESTENLNFAKSLEMNSPIIMHEIEFSKDGDTVDTWATRNNIPSITYEMGEKGEYPHQAIQISSALKMFIENQSNRKSSDDYYTWGQVIYRDENFKLIPNFSNFSRVFKGEEIALTSEKSIKASCD